MPRLRSTSRFLLLATLAGALLTIAVAGGPATAAPGAFVVPRAGFYVGHLTSPDAPPAPVWFYVTKTMQLARFGYSYVYSTRAPSCITKVMIATQTKPALIAATPTGTLFSARGQLSFRGNFLTATSAKGYVSIKGPKSTCGRVDIPFHSFVVSWKNAGQPPE